MVGQVRPGMAAASRNRRGKRPISELHILLAALRDQSARRVGGENLGALEGGGAERPRRVIMRQQHVFDRLVGDLGDARDQLAGHRRRRLRIDHHHAVVANDDAGVGIAFAGIGVEPWAQLVEGDFFVAEFLSRGKRLRHCLNLPADQPVDRPCAAAAHEEMQHDDCPEQRIFDAAVFPGKAELPVVGDDGDHQESDDRARPTRVEKAYRQAEPADEFDGSDDIGPEQAVMETGKFEEFGGCNFISEQNWIAVDGERAAGHQPDQRLGDRRESPVKRAEDRE